MVEQYEDRIHLNLKREVDDSYDIIFGSGMFSKIAKDLKNNPIGSRYAIITDSNVAELYSYELEKKLFSEGVESKVFVFEAGEQSKNTDVAMSLIGNLSKHKYGRGSAVLALGGGVVGDLAGFVAATYLRGIPYIQIPTTILSQADSSIGGKTGVDTEYGKNLVGSFKQPSRVYVDINTLRTLPEMEVKNGLVETVKHGVIQDKDFFAYVEENAQKALELDHNVLMHIAKTNCRIKGTVVEKDPHEKGLRRILNYGHTAGHAIEKLSDYGLAHGACVSMGMMVAGRIANALGFFSEDDLTRQETLFSRLNFPVKIPENITDENIIAVTSNDKKAKGGKARYCLPKRIGEMNDYSGVYADFIDNQFVTEALRRTR